MRHCISTLLPHDKLPQFLHVLAHHVPYRIAGRDRESSWWCRVPAARSVRGARKGTETQGHNRTASNSYVSTHTGARVHVHTPQSVHCAESVVSDNSCALTTRTNRCGCAPKQDRSARNTSHATLCHMEEQTSPMLLSLGRILREQRVCNRKKAELAHPVPCDSESLHSDPAVKSCSRACTA